MKKKTEINLAFLPVFSGIKPTANMTLPTYHRQLQYIEGVLDQLIKEVEKNFDGFSEYIGIQLESIDEGVSEVVSRISYETVEGMAATAVEDELSIFLQRMGKIELDIIDVLVNQGDSDTKLSEIEDRLAQIDLDLESLISSLDGVLTDANAYSDSILADSNDYTDSEVGLLSNRIDALGTDVSGVESIVDGKVQPVADQLDELSTMVDSHENRVLSLEEEITKTPTKLLQGKVGTNTENIVQLEESVQVLTDTMPDTTVLETQVEGLTLLTQANTEAVELNKTDIGDLKFSMSETDMAISELEEAVETLKSEPSNNLLEGRLYAVEEAQGSVDNKFIDIDDFMYNYNNRDTVLERLIKVEEDLDLVGAGSSPEGVAPLEFKGSKLNTQNKLVPVNINNELHRTYKGQLSYQCDTAAELTEVASVKSIDTTALSLSVASDVTGKSLYPQNPVITYQVSYDDVELNGVDLFAEYKHESFKTSIVSTKLAEIAEAVPSGATGFKARVVIDATLVYNVDYSI